MTWDIICCWKALCCVTWASLRNIQAKATRSRTATLLSYWNTDKNVLSSFVHFINKHFGITISNKGIILQLEFFLLRDTLLQEHLIKSKSQDGKKHSQRDWLNAFIVESSLLARKRSKEINKCDSCWLPDSDATRERNRNIHSVLGTGSISVKCLTTLQHWLHKCETHLFQCTWSINYFFADFTIYFFRSLTFLVFAIELQNSMTVRDPLPARHHRLQAHWWERQT